MPSQSDTLMLLVFWRLHERWFALDELAAVAVVAAALAAVLFLVVPRRWALVLPVLTLVFFAGVHRPISARMEYAAEAALAEGMHKQHVDWIDRAVEGRGEVAVLWTGNARASRSGRTSSSTGASAGCSTWAGRWKAASRRRLRGSTAHRRAARRARRAVRPHRRLVGARRSRAGTRRAPQHAPVRGRPASAPGRARRRGCIRATRGRGRSSRTRASTARAARSPYRCRAIRALPAAFARARGGHGHAQAGAAGRSCARARRAARVGRRSLCRTVPGDADEGSRPEGPADSTSTRSPPP